MTMSMAKEEGEGVSLLLLIGGCGGGGRCGKSVEEIVPLDALNEESSGMDSSSGEFGWG